MTLSPYLLMYTRIGSVSDPSSLSTWMFADAAWGVGAAAHLERSAFAFGVDAAWTRTRYERRAVGSGSILGSGHATLGTLLATVRLSSGSLSIPGLPMPVPRQSDGVGFATFVSISAGTLRSDLEDLEETDFDFVFTGGAGFEYRWERRTGVFLEWKRVWQFHEREGVESAVVDHSMLVAGVRIPLR